MRRSIKASTMALFCLAWGASVPVQARPQAVPAPPPTSQAPQAGVEANPETVLATFWVKPDQMAAFLTMMPEYWKTLRTLNLVDAEPHLLMQGEEDGKPIVVQIFTWKSGDIPDHAPPQVQKYWTRMNAMVEPRNGHPGIDFPPMELVDIEHAGHASTR